MQGVEQNFKRTGRNTLERIETASMKQEHDAIEKDQERDFALKMICTHTYDIYIHTQICIYIYMHVCTRKSPKTVEKK